MNRLFVIYFLFIANLSFAQNTFFYKVQSGLQTVLIKNDGNLKVTDKKEIIQGTLVTNLESHIHNPTKYPLRDIWFSANTFIKFDNSGCVSEGTIYQNYDFYPPRKDGASVYESVHFQANTTIKLNSKGEIILGTLEFDKYLTTTTNTNKKFGSGTVIKFASDGRVIEIEQPQKLEVKVNEVKKRNFQVAQFAYLTGTGTREGNEIPIYTAVFLITDFIKNWSGTDVQKIQLTNIICGKTKSDVRKSGSVGWFGPVSNIKYCHIEMQDGIYPFITEEAAEKSLKEYCSKHDKRAEVGEFWVRH